MEKRDGVIVSTQYCVALEIERALLRQGVTASSVVAPWPRVDVHEINKMGIEPPAVVDGQWAGRCKHPRGLDGVCATCAVHQAHAPLQTKAGVSVVTLGLSMIMVLTALLMSGVMAGWVNPLGKAGGCMGRLGYDAQTEIESK